MAFRVAGPAVWRARCRPPLPSCVRLLVIEDDTDDARGGVLDAVQRCGLVGRAAQWQWSSYRYYERDDNSVIAMDWDGSWPIVWP